MNIRPSRGVRLLLFLLLPCLALPAWAGLLQPASTLAPTQPPPAGGSGDSFLPLVSSDGRYVLFASTANNLVLNNSSNPIPVLIPPALNVYLRDRANGTTTLISVNLTGTGGGNGDSLPAGLSDDGRYILFESSATNLVKGDTNNAADIFVRDVLMGTNLLVSISTNGFFANGPSRSSVMTPDGHFVAFVSEASNLVPGDTNRISDVFVRDLQTGKTVLASAGAKPAGTLSSAGGSSEAPDLTPDGHYVVFYSSATNVVPGVRTVGDIYVRDLVNNTTIWASTGARATLQALQRTTNAVCYNHAVSADGQYVVYQTSPASSAYTNGLILRYSLQTGTTDLIHSNAVVGPTAPEDVRSLDMTPDGRFVAFAANSNGIAGMTTCILVWDAQSGETALASGGLDGTVPSGSICDWPMLDASGRFVAFLSSSTNLVTNSLTGEYHLYVRDLQNSTTTLVDADANNVGSLVSPVTVPRLSADGRFVAFECPDGALVANDRNRDYDVFFREWAAGTTELISACDAQLPSHTPNGPSTLSTLSISSDGHWVAFASEADNLTANDTNGVRDVFVQDVSAGTNLLVSVDTNGLPADGVSFEPALSPEGRFVVFTSSADNLVTGDTNKAQDVFVRDLQSGTTALGSVSTNGVAPGNGDSYSPALSADARLVLFRSKARNLVPGNFLGAENLFLRDLERHLTTSLTTTGFVSVASTPDLRYIGITDGAGGGRFYLWDSLQGTLVYTNGGVGIRCVAVSPDGNRVIYQAGSGTYSLFAADLAANTNWMVVMGTNPNTRTAPKFSADSRLMTYAWSPGGVSNYQVYLYDFGTGANQLISKDRISGAAAAGNSDSPDISADGRFIAYRSAATNLVPNDLNGVPDIFVYDCAIGTTTLLSANRFDTTSADNRSLMPVFSADGKMLFFESWASDLVPEDFNHSADILAYDVSAAAIPVFSAWLVPGTAPRYPRIVWPVLPGKSYRVQFKDDLSAPVWQDISKQPTINGNQAVLEDIIPTSDQRFYRVVAY